MRKIREVLRLKFDAGLSVRKIAASLSIGHSSAGDYLCRFAASGLQWPIDISDAELNRRLFPPAVPVPTDQRPMPDWAWVHAELRRPGVTLALLWQEYRLAHPQGFQYSWFCEHYRLWAAKVDVVMRQEHRAGEKLFVDYAGQTAPVIDRQTGEIRQAQIFVAVLGASSYTFAEATWSQKLPDWLGSHVLCFAFFGGTTQILVPDNLRSGVTKAHRYEPDINPSYRDLAEHYGVAVLPARSRKPKDKAKVEVGVQVVERWILAVLRNRQSNSTQPSRYCWIASTTSPSKSCPAHAGQPSRPSTNRPWKACRNTRTSMPNGKRYASISTITLRSMATFTRCRTSW
ncbi:ISPsy14, transposase [Pseudomonas amygdali pv. morsprunorum]|nr:ISPsy14, transposase [Pseudomonas amygdali pv. morsprunorum]